MGLSDEELAKKLQEEERRSSGRARRSSLEYPAADTATSTREGKEPKQPPTKAKAKAKAKQKETGKEEAPQSSPRKRTKLKAKPVSPTVTTKHSSRSSWKLALVGEVSILDASVWGDYAQDEETKLWAEQNKGTKYEVKILAWEETATLSGRSTTGFYSVQHKDEAPFSLPLKVLLPGMSDEARAKVQEVFSASAQSKERKRQKLSSSAESVDDVDTKDTKRQKSAASVDAGEAQATRSEGKSNTASETASKPAVSSVSEREKAKVTTHDPADAFASGGSWGQMKHAVVAPAADIDGFSAGGEWGSSSAAPGSAGKSSSAWGSAAAAASTLKDEAKSSGGWGSAAAAALLSADDAPRSVSGTAAPTAAPSVDESKSSNGWGSDAATATKSSGGWGSAAVAAALAGDATSTIGWGSAAVSAGSADLTASAGWGSAAASAVASHPSTALHGRERLTRSKDQVAGFQRIDNCDMDVDQNVARLLASFSAACVANDRSAKDRLFKDLTMAGCRVFEDPPTFALQPQTSPPAAPAKSSWPSSPRGYANGRAATNVWGADSNQRDRGRWERSAPVGPPTEAGTDFGIAQNWNEEKGFGFIRPSDGGADIFCHCSEIVNATMLPVRSEVTYSVMQDARTGRPRATNVRVTEGADHIYRSAAGNHSQQYHEHSSQAHEPNDPARSRRGDPSQMGGWGSTASDMASDSFRVPATVSVGESSRAQAGAVPSGFRGWRPQESSSSHQAAVIVLDDDDNALAGSSAMQQQQLQSQGGGTRMGLLQQHARQMQHRQRRPVAASQSTEVIELLDSDDEEEKQATRSSNSGDDAYDPCARNAFMTRMVAGKAATASPKNQSTSRSKEATEGIKVVHLAFHQAKKDSFHPLGNLIALRSDSPGSAAWTLANIPAKITVIDKSVEPFFPGLENFPFIELRLPGNDADGADKVSVSEAARIEKFVTRVLRTRQTDRSSSQSPCGRNVAIMAVDWLRDTHPSTMARSELTGHLYLTPSPSLEDERLSLRLYYASQGAPHR